MFSCEICEIFKNTYLEEHQRQTASEVLFSLLFHCESGINQYAVQKTLTDVFGEILLLLELGCLRYVVLLYHLRMLRLL